MIRADVGDKQVYDIIADDYGMFWIIASEQFKYSNS